MNVDFYKTIGLSNSNKKMFLLLKKKISEIAKICIGNF